MEPFIEGARKIPPKRKGFWLEPFIDCTRKNILMIKWFLLKPCIEGSSQNPSYKVLGRTIYRRCLEKPQVLDRTLWKGFYPALKRVPLWEQTEEHCMALLSTFISKSVNVTYSSLPIYPPAIRTFYYLHNTVHSLCANVNVILNVLTTNNAILYTLLFS